MEDEEMRRDFLLKIVQWIDDNVKYDYYYPHRDYLKLALERERNYVLNCSDYPKDLSPEASNRRILHDIERMRKEDGF